MIIMGAKGRIFRLEEPVTPGVSELELLRKPRGSCERT